MTADVSLPVVHVSPDFLNVVRPGGIRSVHARSPGGQPTDGQAAGSVSPAPPRGCHQVQLTYPDDRRLRARGNLSSAIYPASSHRPAAGRRCLPLPTEPLPRHDQTAQQHARTARYAWAAGCGPCDLCNECQMIGLGPRLVVDVCGKPPGWMEESACHELSLSPARPSRWPCPGSSSQSCAASGLGLMRFQKRSRICHAFYGRRASGRA